MIKLTSILLLLPLALSSQSTDVVIEAVPNSVITEHTMVTQLDSVICLPAIQVGRIANSLKSLMVSDSLKAEIIDQQEGIMKVLLLNNKEMFNFSEKQRKTIISNKTKIAILEKKRRAKNKKMWGAAAMGAIAALLITK
jgi:Pyruvate/2-oxoacid:ferredoxin oxidoreductase gamma subunit